ncbi:exo-alpha-sialidase [Candidatus Bathyarchaeota archaeon]|nr:MAG: exo-alpha-sialidase [Candidatus Bathyarchaeota archaeon]
MPSQRTNGLSRLYLLATLIIITSILVIPLQAFAAKPSTPTYASMPGVTNVQASHAVLGGATDRTGACVANAKYDNHHSESWIAVDPTNSHHLVAMSKFFFDPQYYLFHIGAYVSRDGGLHWKDAVIPGFDCQSAPNNSWVDTTDPVLAFDARGNVYSAFLPYSFKYNPDGHQVWGVVPNDAVFVIKSADGGDTWTIGNQGVALETYSSSGLGITADKQWISVDSNPRSPFANNVYVGWTLFAGGSNEMWFSRSSDQGAHFSTPIKISRPNNDGPFNQFIMMGTGPEGTLYAAYTSSPSSKHSMVDVWVLKSTDGGQTFSAPMFAATFRAVSTAALANTTFRDGIADNFAVNPANGHLLLALEVDSGNGVDVQLTESLDRGVHWTSPVNVNDPSTVNDGTDQFQPTVSASPSGTVAVAFYDRRLACPSNDTNILPNDAGRTNFCIDTTIQFYTDGQLGLQAEGSNIRVSSSTWDPQNPGSTTGQLPRPFGPTTSLTFIGDYFGLALSNTTAYVLSVSNHDSGMNPSNDQQQFLGIVPIPSA